MRASRILTGVLFAALFLLMLSALVVAEPTEEGEPLPQPRAYFDAFFAPRAMAEQTTDAAARRQPEHEAAAQTICAEAGFLTASPTRDANGFVLTAARYENCAYHIFRPEVAGG